jgi:hypothetical protein
MHVGRWRGRARRSHVAGRVVNHVGPRDADDLISTTR